jgi:uncharacterized repeat protein (TIGR03803 family)
MIARSAQPAASAHIVEATPSTTGSNSRLKVSSAANCPMFHDAVGPTNQGGRSMKTKSMIWMAAPLLVLTITAVTAKAQTSAPAPVSESLLWSFAGSPDDGNFPASTLIADQRGNLYGTTEVGGANGDGTVFELSPPVGKSSQWSEQVLWSFGSSDDGAISDASLIADKMGNLYGTTARGGASSNCSGGCGTVFELSPPYGKSSTWSERVLYSFAGSPNDGAVPVASLIADEAGNLYSTTVNGGANGKGTIFELSPPYGKSKSWSERVLYNFGATSDDGVFPEASLIADKSGNLYGTTVEGGANSGCDEGCGTAFELSPPYGKSMQWSERVLWSFGANSEDGENPEASLIADKWGNLYGTTFTSIAVGDGIAFELSPPYGQSTQWSEQVLWHFGVTTDDGNEPTASLIADKLGNLYSTTGGGGASSNCSGGCGTVFELSPPYGKSAAWSEQVLWSFAGSPDDGAFPVAGLLADQRGNFYGTTGFGGADGDGAVFELSLPY